MISNLDLVRLKPVQGTHPPIETILDALTFRMMRIVDVNGHFATALLREKFGLTLNEWRVLGLTRALTPATIARQRRVMLIDKGQLSRIVKKLVARGLLIQVPAQQDARSTELLLTPEGMVLHDEVLEFTARRNEFLVASLDPGECKELFRILGKITSHVESLEELEETVK